MYTIVSIYMHIDTISQKGLLTIEDFLTMYGVCRSKFYSEVKNKNIKVKKFGARTYILPEEAKRWASNLPDAE